MKAGTRIRRTYFDCHFGQLHVYQAIPPGGGFDEAMALLCLPGAAGLGSFFDPVLHALGDDRSIYAPDLPGRGASDAPPGAVAAPQHAEALADLLASLYQRRVDVLAQAEGTEIALALHAISPGLIRAMAWSAAPPAAVAAARQQGHALQEFPLAAAGDLRVGEAALQAQLPQLRRCFGPGASS